MKVKRENGIILNKIGLMQNLLFGKIVNVLSAFSTKTNEPHNIALYLFDENTRKSIETARLEAERWKAEAYRLRLNIC